MRFNLRACAKFAVAVLASVALAAPVWSQVDSEDRIHAILEEEILPHEVAIHQLREYLLEHVAKQPVATSASAWTAEVVQTRTHLLKDVVFHGWPREWVEAPPRFEEVGVILGKGYRIRKLRYEIVPGFQSTALLYEPENLKGKMPAVLDVNGHVGALGKAIEYKQKQCINLALHGILTLNLEWLGYGELDQKGNEHWFALHLDLVGTNGLGLFYLSMRKGLDYLYDHPNVDRSRIGMTGLSGGGWQTIVLSALDERVRVAVPVAGFSSIVSRVETRGYIDVGDAEQSATDLLVDVDYTHLVAMMAPRPTLLIYNAEDSCCFRAPLVKPLLFDAIKPIFRLYQAEESLAWHENRDPGTHNYQLDNRLAAYQFFSHHFQMPTIEEEIPVDAQIHSFGELVVGLPAENLTMLGLARKIARSFERSPIPAHDAAWTGLERKKLREILRYQPGRLYRVWTVANTKNTGIESKSYQFKMENGLSATGVLLKAISTREDGPATIVLDDAGRAAAVTVASERINRGEQVLAADLTFTGDWWPKPGALSLEHYLHATGGRTLGIEAAQLIELAHWMRSISGQKQIRLETSGIRTQTIGLIASALEPDLFSAVIVRHGMPSFSYLLDKPVAYYDAPDLFCLDLFKDFDIDRLAAMAEPTQVGYAPDPVH